VKEPGQSHSHTWFGDFADQVAHPDQLAGTRLARVEGGGGDGARILSLWTPHGLEADLQVDRALDLLSVRYGGVRFGWAGPPGISPRGLYEPEGFGWQRTFYGGLLTTCGLEHVGDPVAIQRSEQGAPGGRPVTYGEHGRISHASSEITECEIGPSGPQIRIRGLIRQGAIYDERFELARTIDVDLSRPVITISDTVRNTGSLAARHAILYHLNFGYPVAQQGTFTLSGTKRHDFPAGAPDSPEEVIPWDVKRDADGQGFTTIISKEGSRFVECRQSATLPYFFLWIASRSRTKALGLVPTSSPLDDQVDYLEPDEERRYELQLTFGSNLVNAFPQEGASES